MNESKFKDWVEQNKIQLKMNREEKLARELKRLIKNDYVTGHKGSEVVRVQVVPDGKGTGKSERRPFSQKRTDGWNGISNYGTRKNDIQEMGWDIKRTNIIIKTN